MHNDVRRKENIDYVSIFKWENPLIADTALSYRKSPGDVLHRSVLTQYYHQADWINFQTATLIFITKLPHTVDVRQRTL